MPAALVAVQVGLVPPAAPWQVQETVEPPAAGKVTLAGLAVPEEHMFEEMVVLEPVKRYVA